MGRDEETGHLKIPEMWNAHLVLLWHCVNSFLLDGEVANLSLFFFFFFFFFLDFLANGDLKNQNGKKQVFSRLELAEFSKKNKIINFSTYNILVG
jgi:hypothetical protein